MPNGFSEVSFMLIQSVFLLFFRFNDLVFIQTYYEFRNQCSLKHRPWDALNLRAARQLEKFGCLNPILANFITGQRQFMSLCFDSHYLMRRFTEGYEKPQIVPGGKKV